MIMFETGCWLENLALNIKIREAKMKGNDKALAKLLKQKQRLKRAAEKIKFMA